MTAPSASAALAANESRADRNPPGSDFNVIIFHRPPKVQGIKIAAWQIELVRLLLVLDVITCHRLGQQACNRTRFVFSARCDRRCYTASSAVSALEMIQLKEAKLDLPATSDFCCQSPSRSRAPIDSSTSCTGMISIGPNAASRNDYQLYAFDWQEARNACSRSCHLQQSHG